MDLSTVAAGEPSFKGPVHEVIDLTSDDEAGCDHGLEEGGEGSVTEVVDGDVNSEDENEADGSESMSLLEDVLEEMGDEHLFHGEQDACTLEEARAYRLLLRTVGPEQFCRQTVENDSITAKKLLTAFGIRPPPFLEEEPDEAYYGLLSLALQRELSKRVKLPQYNTIDDAVELLKSSKNIIVLTGAGISTSLGIPDFRSKDVGLYSKLEHLGLADPQDVFDIELFRQDPTIFYTIAKDILPSTDRFSPTHAFIRLLQEKGKLLTNYSQNIDNIEAKAGILPEKLIQCHGSFATASCVKCHAQVPGSTIFPDMQAGNIPRCQACLVDLHKSSQFVGMKRKRSQNGTDKKRQRRFEGSSDSSDEDEDDNIPEAGVMKPDITFFGEALPDTFHERLTKHDKDLVDLVIVIGTSLKVAPVSEVVPYLPAHIPQMYISRTPVSHVEFDVDMLGDCDVVVAELCRRAGWELKHEMIPKEQMVDVMQQEGFPHRHVFRERRSGLEGAERDGLSEDESKNEEVKEYEDRR